MNPKLIIIIFGKQIYRPQNITTGTSNTFLHLHDKTVHRRDTAKLFNQKEVIAIIFFFFQLEI